MTNRREFLKTLGLSAGLLPFMSNLEAFATPVRRSTRKQRLVVLFSPNGTVPWDFWPEQEGDQFQLGRILAPLQPWQDRMMVLHGVCDKVRGDGDNHMRGMGCLLTGIELFPVTFREVQILRLAGPAVCRSIRRSRTFCSRKKKRRRDSARLSSV